VAASEYGNVVALWSTLPKLLRSHAIMFVPNWLPASANVRLACIQEAASVGGLSLFQRLPVGPKRAENCHRSKSAAIQIQRLWRWPGQEGVPVPKPTIFIDCQCIC
jgi:hypothetical protein